MEKLKSIDFRSVIFLLLACVTPAVSPNIALPVALIVLSAMKGFDLWMETKKAIDPSPELRAEIQGIKNQMSGIMVKNSVKPEEQAFKRMF
jgi:hypothetical protein